MKNKIIAIDDDIETKAQSKRSTKVRRTNKELQHDLLKYKELVVRDHGLELDIPPKRTKTVEREQEIRTHNKKVSSRSSRYRNRRVILEEGTVKKCAVSSMQSPQNEINDTTKGYQILKPRYWNQNQKKFQRYQSNYNPDKISPPSLTDITRFRSFEDKILLNHSYQELIKLLKSEINSSKPKINEKSIDETIDIPILWKLFPKNIDIEKKRFDITDPFLFDFQPLNMTSTNLFCSEDIDVFFQKLSDNSNFDHFNEGNLEFDTETLIRKNLKKTVPFA